MLSEYEQHFYTKVVRIWVTFLYKSGSETAQHFNWKSRQILSNIFPKESNSICRIWATFLYKKLSESGPETAQHFNWKSCHILNNISQKKVILCAKSNQLFIENVFRIAGIFYRENCQNIRNFFENYFTGKDVRIRATLLMEKICQKLRKISIGKVVRHLATFLKRKWFYRNIKFMNVFYRKSLESHHIFSANMIRFWAAHLQ